MMKFIWFSTLKADIPKSYGFQISKNYKYNYHFYHLLDVCDLIFIQEWFLPDYVLLQQRWRLYHNNWMCQKKVVIKPIGIKSYQI